jgi:iron(III) transport system ATP-binding protein
VASVSLAGVHQSYGSNAVVRGIDLAVADGEVVALLGGSGCGKTTTLRAVAGLERISAGTIRIGDEVVAGPGIHVAPERRRLGMVFQSYAVWPHLDVFENIAFPLRIARAPDVDARVRQVVATVQLDGLERRRPSELSGGQQQRVAIARALVAEPRVLLLDEPLSNLDANLRLELREEIRALVRRIGVTVLLVTHDQDEAFAVADRIALMDGGRIAQFDVPRALYEAPATAAVAMFLGASQRLTGVRTSSGVRVDGVDVDATAVDDSPIEGQVDLAFRAQDASLAPEGIPGRVVDATWLGTCVRLRIRVGDVVVAALDATGADVGANVRIRLEHAFILPSRRQ